MSFLTPEQKTQLIDRQYNKTLTRQRQKCLGNARRASMGRHDAPKMLKYFEMLWDSGVAAHTMTVAEMVRRWTHISSIKTVQSTQPVGHRCFMLGIEEDRVNARADAILETFPDDPPQMEEYALQMAMFEEVQR